MDNNIDELFHDMLANEKTSLDMKAWEDAEALLNKPRRKKRMWFFMLFLGALVGTTSLVWLASKWNAKRPEAETISSIIGNEMLSEAGYVKEVVPSQDLSHRIDKVETERNANPTMNAIDVIPSSAGNTPVEKSGIDIVNEEVTFVKDEVSTPSLDYTLTNEIAPQAEVNTNKISVSIDRNSSGLLDNPRLNFRVYDILKLDKRLQIPSLVGLSQSPEKLNINPLKFKSKSLTMSAQLYAGVGYRHNFNPLVSDGVIIQELRNVSTHYQGIGVASRYKSLRLSLGLQQHRYNYTETVKTEEKGSIEEAYLVYAVVQKGLNTNGVEHWLIEERVERKLVDFHEQVEQYEVNNQVKLFQVPIELGYVLDVTRGRIEIVPQVGIILNKMTSTDGLQFDLENNRAVPLQVSTVKPFYTGGLGILWNAYGRFGIELNTKLLSDDLRLGTFTYPTTNNTFNADIRLRYRFLTK